jgi:MFS family permease
MAGFSQLLRGNRNYRYTWFGQVVSEFGDHFNNIAVFSLALANTKSGIVVSGIMLSRAVPMLMAGPLAGVILDRMDRRRVMIASDIARAVVALAFILAVERSSTVWLYPLSAMLMFASPFFTSGRSAILPSIATKEELHTANTLTQTTQWTTLTLGGFFAGIAVKQFGYEWAFVLNSLSFVFSAWCISQLRVPKRVIDGIRTAHESITEVDWMQSWREYREGLRYMRSIPLLFAIAMVYVGWATGGGAAQILFGLFGDIVFQRGSVGIGTIWSAAGLGLVIGGMFAHWLGPKLSFRSYKRTVSICYLVHGATYILFSQMPQFWQALVFIAVSRAAVAVSSVLNMTQMLLTVDDEFRGRVFATMETFTWGVMMLSMMGAGAASEYYSPRTIGAWAGALSSTTAFFWAFADSRGRLPQPQRAGRERDEVELHGESTV